MNQTTKNAVKEATVHLEAYLKRLNCPLSTERNGETGLFVESPGFALDDLEDFVTRGLKLNLSEVIPQGKDTLPLPLKKGPSKSNLHLKSLALTRARPSRVEFTIEWKNWTYKLADDFEIQELEGSFTVIGKNVEAQLDAKLKVHGVELELGAQLPGLLFEATLESDPADAHHQLIGKFALGEGLQPTTKKDAHPVSNNPKLHDLCVSIALRQKRFLLHFCIEDLLNIEPLRLQYVQLDLLYAAGMDGERSGQIWGEIEIGEPGTTLVNILVSAELERSGGWRFSGSIGGSGLTVKELLPALEKTFKIKAIELPDFIATLELVGLSVEFRTDNHDFRFCCEVMFRLSEHEPEVDLRLEINLKHDGSAYTHELVSTIRSGEYEFKLDFEQTRQGNASKADRCLVLTYTDQGDGLDFKTALKSLVSSGSFNGFPDFKIKLKAVVFVYSKPAHIDGDGEHDRGAAKKKYLFGLDFGAHINSSKLPLVGKMLPASATLRIDDLRILYTSEAFNSQEANDINHVFAAANPAIPSLPVPPWQGGAKGLRFSARFDFGSTPHPFSIPTKADSIAKGTDADTGGNGVSTPGAGTPVPGAPAPSPAPDNATWINLQKKLGPFYFEKVGVHLAKGELWFLLSADLSMGGMTLSLDGLGVGSSLKKFEPKFDLRGLGLEYEKGPLEIGGMFLRSTVPDVTGGTYDEYDGMATVKAETFSLGAIGSYARLHGHPSLFLYVSIDTPLGGPPFFYVTGLSAGFGYNRALKMPPVEQIRQFPLVSEVLPAAETEPTKPDSGEESAPQDSESPSNSQARQDTLTTKMDMLRQYIPPEVGEYWLAVGLRFTTFEILDSFAMLSVAFGNRFELHILGVMSYSTPPDAAEGTPALMRVELNIEASFLPDEGFLGVKAVLTNNSYLFDPNCHLTGGMAFYSWFSGPHDGDFVVTVGGYHPKFKVPSYYPRVPRLGFNWQFSDQLGIKGGVYFALTGHALMAGGYLDALWDSGGLRAWFKAGADFLIMWKPYHYDADIYVEIGASATIHFCGTHHLTVSLGADLSVWGPKLAGKATLHILIVSFSISFGGGPAMPKAISWDEFRKSFLPAGDENIVSVSVQSGLVKSVAAKAADASGGNVENPQVATSPEKKKDKKEKPAWILNARHFRLAVNSVIPITSVEGIAVSKDFKVSKQSECTGIAPMDLRENDFKSTLEITVNSVNSVNDGNVTTLDVAYEPLLKPMPAGLWGNVFQPDVNSKQMVDGVLAGISIIPKRQPKPGATKAVNKRNLAFETETVKDAFNWQDKWSKLSQPTGEARATKEQINATNGAAARKQLLQGLFTDDDLNGPLAATEFLAHPLLADANVKH